MLPQLQIIGNLTADPELRYTQSGKAVANFTIAASDSKFDQQAQRWVDDGDPLFQRCVVWNELAEQVAQLQKGSRVVAVGKLTSRSYETREGQKRDYTELVVHTIGEVIRPARNNGGGRRDEGWGSPRQDEPWGQPAQQGGWGAPQSAPPQQRPPAQAQAQPDVWNAPGAYSDETPF